MVCSRLNPDPFLQVVGEDFVPGGLVAGRAHPEAGRIDARQGLARFHVLQGFEQQAPDLDDAEDLQAFFE